MAISLKSLEPMVLRYVLPLWEKRMGVSIMSEGAWPPVPEHVVECEGVLPEKPVVPPEAPRVVLVKALLAGLGDRERADVVGEWCGDCGRPKAERCAYWKGRSL